MRRPSRQLAAQFADGLGLVGDERAAFLAAARAVGCGDMPAPSGTDADSAPAATAASVHSTVGRAVELSALAALFAEPMTRLVSIVGPGGMGKTRIAIALAEQLLVPSGSLMGCASSPWRRSTPRSS